MSILVTGVAGSGTTALAASIAMSSSFPFIKLVSPESMVGMNESQKMNSIHKVFSDAYRSPASVIVLDSLERLLDWVSIGPRFSNIVLQALLVLLKKPPPKNHKLLVLCTSSLPRILQEMELMDVFQHTLAVPMIETTEHLMYVLEKLGSFTKLELSSLLVQLPIGFRIPIKRLISVCEMAAQDTDKVEKFVELMKGYY